MRLFRKPADYEAFLHILDRTLQSQPMRICAFCLMPNHWHLVLWPEEDGQLGPFMQKLTITHVRNWQEHHGRVGEGHVYQGRYKSFPIEDDEHFYHVVRYVERNALRAGLVDEAEQWRFGSLNRQTHPANDGLQLLSPWPAPRPRNWRQHVNRAQTNAELEAIRRSLVRGQPYGDANWVRQTASALGLESTLRRRGRPKRSA